MKDNSETVFFLTSKQNFQENMGDLKVLCNFKGLNSVFFSVGIKISQGRRASIAFMLHQVYEM